jgi:mRNA interferase HigB
MCSAKVGVAGKYERRVFRISRVRARECRIKNALCLPGAGGFPQVWPYFSGRAECDLGSCTHIGYKSKILKVRIIARRTLYRYVESLVGHKDQRAVKAALDSWFHEAVAADWRTPADVTKKYASASIVGSDRVVFNIKGNDHRLVTAIDYKRRTIFIKWVGSHAEYDKIDVKTVNYEHQTD